MLKLLMWDTTAVLVCMTLGAFIAYGYWIHALATVCLLFLAGIIEAYYEICNDIAQAYYGDSDEHDPTNTTNTHNP